MRCSLQVAAVAVALVACGQVLADQPTTSSIGKKIDSFSLPDVHGNNRTLGEPRGDKALVVAFVGVECPLVKQYVPRLVLLAAEYEAQGVKFVAIDSNLQDSLAEIAHFAKMHELKFPVLKDMNNRVADAFGAMRTPEVFVVDSGDVVRYAGRVDDQFGFKTGAGYAKPRLERARPGRGPGRSIGRQAGQPADGQDRRLLDWPREARAARRRHVLESDRADLAMRCLVCHREGEVAPFSVESYDEVVGWAEMIREVVKDERMPPWYANPAHGKYSNDARLTDDEKALVNQWVDNGCPEGDKSQLPAAPSSPRVGGLASRTR